MKNDPYVMLDPTAEAAPASRERVSPPESLAGAKIGLLSITKERSDEFLDTLETRLVERGLTVLRFRKLSHTKPAPEAVIQDIVEHCDVIVEGLAD